jgi:hypothetical protein
MKRHRDALEIQNHGACNPSGIAIAISNACAEVRTLPNGIASKDSAVRLMVHQLAFVCGLSVDMSPTDYNAAIAECEANSKEESRK